MDNYVEESVVSIDARRTGNTLPNSVETCEEHMASRPRIKGNLIQLEVATKG